MVSRRVLSRKEEDILLETSREKGKVLEAHCPMLISAGLLDADNNYNFGKNGSMIKQNGATRAYATVLNEEGRFSQYK